MTDYEKSLQDGFPAMNGMEWLFLEKACEDILNGNITKYDKEYLPTLIMEIEHLYRNDITKLNEIKRKLDLID